MNKQTVKIHYADDETGPAEVLSGDRIRDVFQVDPSILPIGPWTTASREGAPA